MSQQWEYCVVVTASYSVPQKPGNAGQRRLYGGVTFCQAEGDMNKEIVRKEIPDEGREVPFEPEEVMRVVARLGMAGWELVNVNMHQASTGSTNWLFFKRPVEAGRTIDDAF